LDPNQSEARNGAGDNMLYPDVYIDQESCNESAKMDIKSFGRHIGVPIDSSDTDENGTQYGRQEMSLQINGKSESTHIPRDPKNLNWYN
jgi:hypothetical protein